MVQDQDRQSEKNCSQFLKLQGKPFWHWDGMLHREKHRINRGNCCFNHIIGLPRKDGVEKPMFDYEAVLYKGLLEPGYLNSRPASRSMKPKNIALPFKLKHLWVKKATGLGVTEFMLRFMAWLCLRNDDQMFIVPVPFSIEGAKMLQHAKWLLEEKEEDGGSLIAIHKERFHKLVTALRTAVANEYKLDKEQTSYNDILDAFRLSLKFYKRSKA